jgi:ribosomal protein L37AE/L43A
MQIPTFSNANQALTLIGSLADLVKKGATIDLQTAIISLKESVLALKEENLSLKERVSELERLQQQKDALIFEIPNYYQMRTDGTKDGPFCQVCQDTKSRLVRLKVEEPGLWHCGSCNQRFETEERRRRVEAEIESYNRSLERERW